MLRPSVLLLAGALAATIAAAPAEVTRSAPDTSAPVGADVEDGTFPIGVCAWARPVSSGEKTCVIVNDPRPWLP